MGSTQRAATLTSHNKEKAMSDDTQSPSRRNLIKSMMFVPIGAVAATGAVRALSTATAADANAPEGKPNAYTPTFFNQVEWKFLSAAVDRLIPHDEHGPGAIELGVLEFLDRHMQTPFAAGDIWYMQGRSCKPSRSSAIRASWRCATSSASASRMWTAIALRNSVERPLPTWIASSRKKSSKGCEGGKLKLEEISAKLFFTNLLSEVRNGYFADPKHGGNKGMGAWKMIGYPGMRADYLDWVEVRDKPYPIGPVDLAGRRG
jgi:gluconate 2-dehydrogenase gamma chain